MEENRNYFADDVRAELARLHNEYDPFYVVYDYKAEFSEFTPDEFILEINFLNDKDIGDERGTIFVNAGEQLKFHVHKSAYLNGGLEKMVKNWCRKVEW